MFPRRGQLRVRDMVLLGGWLFADLLLGLMMIFLVSIQGGRFPDPCAPPTPTPTATQLPGAGLPGAVWNGETGLGSSRARSPFSVLAPTPTPCRATETPTPTQTPTKCGLDKTGVDSNTFEVPDPDGLRNDSPSAQASFDATVAQLYAGYAGKTAGLVEIFGGTGGPDVGFGIIFAQHAEKALLLPANAGFIFDSTQTLFQDFAQTNLSTSQMDIIVFFYETSATGKCGS